MDKEAVKHLCQSGAFSIFMEILSEIEEPEVKYGEDVNYQLGKRDGYRECKDTLIVTINNFAKE